MSLVEYRRARADEQLSFIVPTWSSNYRGAHAAGMLSMTPLEADCPNCRGPISYDYATVMHYTLRHALARPGVEAWVVANPKGKPPVDLHGWLVWERDANVPSYEPPNYELKRKATNLPLVHYVYVKNEYRGFGFARGLFAAAGINPYAALLYTCKTPVVGQLEGVVKGKRVGPNKIPQARWSPLCVRVAKKEESR